MYKSLIIFLLAAASCTESETVRTQDEGPSGRQGSTLEGTWVLTEQKVSIGSPATWTAVESGDTIRFGADGSFAWQHLDCEPKSYERVDDLIKLTYDCPEDSEYADQPSYSDRIDYQLITLTTSYLTVTPATFRCTEECSYKYTRIGDAER